MKEIVGERRIFSGIGIPFHGAFIRDAELNPGSLRVLRGSEFRVSIACAVK
jgi:hypothetical protein